MLRIIPDLLIIWISGCVWVRWAGKTSLAYHYYHIISISLLRTGPDLFIPVPPRAQTSSHAVDALRSALTVLSTARLLHVGRPDPGADAKMIIIC